MIVWGIVIPYVTHCCHRESCSFGEGYTGDGRGVHSLQQRSEKTLHLTAALGSGPQTPTEGPSSNPPTPNKIPARRDFVLSVKVHPWEPPWIFAFMFLNFDSVSWSVVVEPPEGGSSKKENTWAQLHNTAYIKQKIYNFLLVSKCLLMAKQKLAR